jgi:hypothetical protein
LISPTAVTPKGATRLAFAADASGLNVRLAVKISSAVLDEACECGLLCGGQT